MDEREGVVERTFRRESGRATATLIRVLGDFDLAGDAVQDAFLVALERWPAEGVPTNPGAWIIRVARNKAIDRLRRERVLGGKLELIAREEPESDPGPGLPDPWEELSDDRLRLIFTCCHPALAPEARVALTLRTLGGLRTDEVAAAFLVSEATMAQRIVRAKRKIRDGGIRYEVPSPERLTERLGSVLATLYLIFNAGYTALDDARLVRAELCSEAIRLTRDLLAMLPAEREVAGLLALMLFSDSRREARTDDRGAIVLLADQDRSAWDAAKIAEGAELVTRALGRPAARPASVPGPYALQAAIAAEHARAARAEDTDWSRILALYDWLLFVQPTPVVELNRAVALAMARGPERGLEALGRIEGLESYMHLESARAELLRRSGRAEEATMAYRRAVELASNPVERDFLERRIAELGG